MRTELSKAEVERLFIGAADGALAPRDAETIDQDVALKAKLAKYKSALKLLKETPKEKAPPALASVIMRRVRRRRIWGRANHDQMQMQVSVPMQVIVPILLGVLVAAFLVFAAP